MLNQNNLEVNVNSRILAGHLYGVVSEVKATNNVQALLDQQWNGGGGRADLLVGGCGWLRADRIKSFIRLPSGVC